MNIPERTVNSSRRVPFLPRTRNPARPSIIQIRIPGLMCIKYGQTQRSADCQEQAQAYMLENYRKQVGDHAFVSHINGQTYGSLRFAMCEELNDMSYHCHDSFNQLTSFYPCYRERDKWAVGETDEQQTERTRKRFEIVFGLCFVPKLAETRVRTWSRCYHLDQGNEFAFDVVSNMFDVTKKDDVKRGDHYANTTLFPEVPPTTIQEGEQWSVAFYVCQGARVILVDHRYYKGKQQYETDKKGSHCRSLCQQGSVIIVRGKSRFGMRIHSEHNEEEVKTWTPERQALQRYLSPYYRPFIESDLIRPKGQFTQNTCDLDSKEKEIDINRLQGSKYENVRFLKDKVIFLGATESQFNSACWEIEITSTQTIDHDVRLWASDGAVIVDIAPWRTGFELIYWRQRYERLYESIVLNFEVPPYDENTQFGVPADDYIFQRIVGIKSDVRTTDGIRDGWYNTCEIAVPLQTNRTWLVEDRDNHGTNNRDQDIRRYIPLQDECKANLLMRNIEMRNALPNYHSYPGLTNNARLPPLPLYPPYQLEKDKEEYGYLSNYEKVVSVGAGSMMFKVVSKEPGDNAVDPYQLFTLDTREIDAYYWKISNGNEPAQTKFRLGSDYLRYYKYSEEGQTVPKVKSFCLIQAGKLKPRPEEQAKDPVPEESGKSSPEHKKQKKDESKKKGSEDSGGGSGQKSSQSSGEKSVDKKKSSSESEKKKKKSGK